MPLYTHVKTITNIFNNFDRIILAECVCGKTVAAALKRFGKSVKIIVYRSDTYTGID